MIKLDMYVHFFFWESHQFRHILRKVYDLKRVGTNHTKPFKIMMKEHTSPAVVVKKKKKVHYHGQLKWCDLKIYYEIYIYTVITFNCFAKAQTMGK